VTKRRRVHRGGGPFRIQQSPTPQIPEQIFTVNDLSPTEVMRAREFALGFEDVRAGRPARFDTFGEPNSAWHYERGRQFATIAPLSMRLHINGDLNPRALVLFEAAVRRRDIE